ncbi:FadR/GntR family transcriptional regulator [Amnibacterium kyonggiense]|uniref:DNA-binding FadR family transcriptional regulator n=1 Tax=Amnibacterium kyonggiense TaxID=595671 RepID=A0A4R7FQD0_9MICO|nr:FCD domain-containing protein [Amnibacterium kyonggiense]TDS79981.1 DNA-binding FadR family transcriptional regulator [Amnibacterium kyonggiense]
MSASLELRGLVAPESQQRPADTFMREIADSIISGRYAEGEVLPPEAVLGGYFRVSRTIIRESMKRLEEKGLVAIQQGRGTLVQPHARWNVLDPLVLSAVIAHDEQLHTLDELTLVRGALESVMAGQAARRASAAEREELRAALEEMREAEGDYTRFRDADADFHRIVMRLSGNFLAGNIADTLYSRAREFSRFEGHPPADASQRTLAQHRAVYEAVAAGDEEAARAAMNEHIVDAWRRRSGTAG